MKTVDLHTHSTASDGTLSPSELVEYAASKGLLAIALTDHDTVSGLDEALKKAEELRANGIDFELIPGIELSSAYEGKEIHIVGLYIDHNSDYLKSRLAHFVINRQKRNEQLCKLLVQKGMPVTLEELNEEFGNSVITRAHYAKLLMKKGYVSSVKEGFDRYLGDDKPCFVKRRKITPMRAVEIIRKSGGFPVFAHPVLAGMSKSRLDELTARLKASGLCGIEAIYGTYDPSDERDIRALAQKYDLAISGGSDFHGQNKAHIEIGIGTGKMFMPSEHLDNIKSIYNLLSPKASDFRLPKILFTDLDGTLLDSNKNISEYTFSVLKEWTKAGHYIALSSGRDINSVKDVYHHIGLDSLDNVFVIGYNGGEIRECRTNKCLYKNPLNIEDVRYIRDKATEAGIYIQTYSDTHIIAPAETPELEFYTRVIKTPVMISGDITEPLTEGPCKCLCIDLNGRSRLQEFIDSLSGYCKEHGITMMFSSDKYLEVIPSSSGKGAAVHELCKLLDIPNLISVSAGDEDNDVSMLEATDVAIAMDNASNLAKNASTTISDGDNDHDGLARTLADMI
ncbi:MAG: Cof-type HAD-IIB family hydrolase [Lachnospiraceae bacterium]|nr:Cof-type HAD-IIB family hydrolase [Lachnospiraceae bacterium]